MTTMEDALMASKVILSQDERAVIADEVFDKQQKLPGHPLLDLFNEAQRLLPQHRRRKVGYQSQLPAWLKPMLEERRAELRNRPSSSYPKPEVTKPEPESSESDPVLIEILEVLRSIKGELANIRELTRQNGIVAPDDSQEAEPDKPRPKKPKVVLLGLLPAQEHEIEVAYGSIFDLKFTKDVGRVKDMVRHADKVIGMCGKISHSMEDVVKSTNPEAYTAVPGGISTIKAYLEDLWVELEEANNAGNADNP